MHSIRTKITALTVCAVIAVMIVAAVSGVYAIKNIGTQSAEQMMLLLCESGEKNLDSYFSSVEQSVEMVSAYVESDLDGIDEAHLQAHLDRVDDIFKRLTYKTQGVLTYYYRIDPAVSQTAKGFWYVNLNGEGFTEHEVTDITQYNTYNTNELVWFTVPKSTGRSVWLPPYITDNLDVRVISYNVPVYYAEQFVGVIGIEIDYSTMAEQVDSITLYKNGYAFISTSDGELVYHPRIDVTATDSHPEIPGELAGLKTFINYTYNGVEKQCVWLELENGMRLFVSVPLNEINAGWMHWAFSVIIVFAVLLFVFITIMLSAMGRITKPLGKLTEAAIQVDEGNYDIQLDHDSKDEVGILSRTFKMLISHLKVYISDLNDLAYADALTSLHNKGAFDICVRNMQTQMKEEGKSIEFAVCIFDCNDLKKINDSNGHDKGDIYLKEAASVICEVFEHSPVFRIGGDEFAAMLIGRDYDEREALLKRFDEACEAKRRDAVLSWEKVDIARGMAVFNPDDDMSVSDVIRRADKLMYENKWMLKEARKKEAKGEESTGDNV